MSELQTSQEHERQDTSPSSHGSFARIEAFFLCHRQACLYVVVFLLTLLLVMPSLMPSFSVINPDDEAKYVESGWRLLRGDIRDLAWGPIVALVYAPVHLIVGGSPDWFMIETWTGRIVLYSFLWWSIFYLALQFKEYVSPYIMLGVLFISVPFFSVVQNQSDAVFVGFSALALAFLLKFYQDRKLRDLCIGSLMVGLGTLARVETIILIVFMVVMGIFIGRHHFALYKLLLYSILPAICVIGLFFIASLIMVGNLNLGIAYKSYDSFEMNQSVLTGGDIELARQETRRLFGTQEENQGSVLRAILRNPVAFGVRMLANVKTIPINYFTFFGKKLGAILLPFVAWGVYALIRKKAFVPLIILLIWPIHALIALGFLALHIVPQVSYLPLLLGAIGIAWIFRRDFNPREQTVFLIASLLLLTFTIVIKKPAFTVAFVLLVFVLIIHWLLQTTWKPHSQVLQVSIFLLLAAGLILHEPFAFPNYPKLGASSGEQAVHYLEQNLPTQSVILAPTPLVAVASRMAFLTTNDIPTSISTNEDFWNWLKQNNVSAIYLDKNRRGRNDIYDLFEQGYSPYFTPAFNSADNNVRVFTVK
jgi:hypothetical protein